ncbi:MAG: septum formation protein Maf [Bacteroidales bacterium]|nr:septum formation protein Maf [Bacteroidales bacterium]
MQLILASKSPRRRQLLASLGFPVTYADISVDETLEDDVPIALAAETIARRKTEGYNAALLQKDQVLITADTLVIADGQRLGKPKDRNDAIGMLHRLSGQAHIVYTGVCLRHKDWQTSFTEATMVHFRHIAEEEIIHYVDTYKPYDKAGAYGIQEWIGMIGIDRIEGDYYNVMGLPLCRLYSEIRKQMDLRLDA